MESIYTELNIVSLEIAKWAGRGLTDKQIGDKVGYHYYTVYRYRRALGIQAGRYQKGRKPRRKLPRDTSEVCTPSIF